MLAINIFVFLDALKVKSRLFLIGLGCLFIALNINNIYNDTFGDWNKGIVIISYTIQGEEYTIMKRSTQRSIFLQILLFSMAAVYTMFIDKKMEFLIFATGNIYRETGTSSEQKFSGTFIKRRRRERKRKMDGQSLFK